MSKPSRYCDGFILASARVSCLEQRLVFRLLVTVRFEDGTGVATAVMAARRMPFGGQIKYIFYLVIRDPAGSDETATLSAGDEPGAGWHRHTRV